MKFTKAQLKSFIKLCRQEFGEELSEVEALKQATALVSIVKLTYEPMTQEEFDKYDSL